MIIYKDDHGVGTFFKEDFYSGIQDFFREQAPLERAKDGKDYAIAVAKDDEYKRHLRA